MLSHLNARNYDMPSFYMPEESSMHARTWMAFVASDLIWSTQQIPEVKRNLVLIAKTIAQYEPVSMLVNPDDFDEAKGLIDDIESLNYGIDLVKYEIDDLWLRDTGPTFIKAGNGRKHAIDFNFNGWGEKQDYQRDAKVAAFIAEYSQSSLENTELVLEGGCFEVDGHGTAILTKSSVLNDNRNPHLSQHEIEQELQRLLGLRKIIWLDGIKGKDITDGHIDFYARFTKEGEVIVSRENDKASFDYDVTRDNIRILRNSTDADGKQLNVIVLDNPKEINEQYGWQDFAAGYIGYYVCNGAVIMQSFGDDSADRNAKHILQTVFPDRAIEQIAIDGIASGGGSIHCATQQEII